MKKLFVATLLIGLGLFSQAQDGTFKPFKFDIALGYALPSGTGSKGGVLIAFEPKYALNDQITLGLRWEGAVTAAVSIDANGEAVKGEAKASGSYLLTTDYYFGTNKLRPFAGIGAGLYNNAAVDINSEEAKTSHKFGFAPRVGFEYGHFRTAIEYNIAGKTEHYNNNYLGIKMGFFIGGGRLE